MLFLNTEGKTTIKHFFFCDLLDISLVIEVFIIKSHFNNLFMKLISKTFQCTHFTITSLNGKWILQEYMYQMWKLGQM